MANHLHYLITEPTLTFGKVFQFQSIDLPSYAVRIKNGEIWMGSLDTSNEEKYAFKIVPGLSGSGVSMQSISRPEKYIRHRQLKLFYGLNDESEKFKEEASFILHQGLTITTQLTVSFEAVSARGFFIRHENFRLVLSNDNNSEVEKKTGAWIPKPSK